MNITNYYRQLALHDLGIPADPIVFDMKSFIDKKLNDFGKLKPLDETLLDNQILIELIFFMYDRLRNLQCYSGKKIPTNLYFGKTEIDISFVYYTVSHNIVLNINRKYDNVYDLLHSKLSYQDMNRIITDHLCSEFNGFNNENIRYVNILFEHNIINDTIK